jgi:GMP synthase (glutamine-hydrolysing)
VLGICYGHQLLAHGLGGEVGRNPRGREIGTVAVEVADPRDRLLAGLPTRLTVQVTHRESVLRLPDGAARLAGNPADPHQAFRFGERAWGVQFHPEFDADVMRGYLRARREELIGEGLDPDALLAACVEAPDGERLLARFAEIVMDLEGGARG